MNDGEVNKHLISAQDAANILQVSRPTVVRLLHEGYIPYIMYGTHYKIEREAVLKYKKDSKFMSKEQALEEKIVQLKTVTREANEALQAFKEAKKDLKQTADFIIKEYHEWVHSEIEKKVKSQLDNLSAATKKAIEETEKAIFKRFDDLIFALMQGSDKRQVSVDEAVLAHQTLDNFKNRLAKEKTKIPSTINPDKGVTILVISEDEDEGI